MPNIKYFIPFIFLLFLYSCNEKVDFSFPGNEEIIMYTLDGENIIARPETIIFTPANDSYELRPTLKIKTKDNCSFIFAVLNFSPSTGSYPYSEFDGSDDITPGFSILDCIEDVSNTNNHIVFNLTKLGEIGDYIDISFAGNYEDSSENTHTINGSIHVLRD